MPGNDFIVDLQFGCLARVIDMRLGQQRANAETQQERN
jgi:hypothetical protein